MNPVENKQPSEGQVATYREHDCHEPMNQHWHVQKGVYTYSTCGTCGNITKIEKAPELTALKSQADGLAISLEKYGVHSNNCSSSLKGSGFLGGVDWSNIQLPCDCGFTAALEAYRKGK